MAKALALTALIAVGVSLGAALAAWSPGPAIDQPIEWLDNPRPLRPFELTSANGSIDNQSLRGRWTVFLFGFLNCPDICPTSVSELAALSKQLPSLSSAREVALVFVSVDPERDSPADVSEYARAFDPGLRGTTASRHQLDHLTHDLGIAYEVTTTASRYDVSHSTTFSIVGPEGSLRGRFRPGFDPAKLARSLADTIRKSR